MALKNEKETGFLDKVKGYKENITTIFSILSFFILGVKIYITGGNLADSSEDLRAFIVFLEALNILLLIVVLTIFTKDRWSINNKVNDEAFNKLEVLNRNLLNFVDEDKSYFKIIEILIKLQKFSDKLPKVGYREVNDLRKEFIDKIEKLQCEIHYIKDNQSLKCILVLLKELEQLLSEYKPSFNIDCYDFTKERITEIDKEKSGFFISKLDKILIEFESLIKDQKKKKENPKDDCCNKDDSLTKGLFIRIDNLLRQLLTPIQGFAVCLLFLYLVLFIGDVRKPSLDFELRKALPLKEFNIPQDNNTLGIGEPSLNTYHKIELLDKRDSLVLREIGHLKNLLMFIKDTTMKHDTVIHNDSLKLGFKKINVDSINLKLIDKNEEQISIESKIDTFKQKREEVFIYKGLDSVLLDQDNNSLSHLFTQNKINVNEGIKPYIINQRNNYTVGFILRDFLDNLFNSFSAAFLLIMFQVLYYSTLKNDNTSNIINYWVPLGFATAINLFALLAIMLGIGKLPLATVLFIFKLISGTFNAVAMLLLFGRFVALESFVVDEEENLTQEQKNKEHFKERIFYLIGTVAILPIYAVIQTVWGLFNFKDTEIGNILIFKTIVLLICLIGKVFLFLFLYTMLQKKWIHVFFHNYQIKEKYGRLVSKILNPLPQENISE